MEKWFIKNGTKFSFFVVGWCVCACANALIDGEYVFAAINGLLAYLNVQIGRQWD